MRRRPRITAEHRAATQLAHQSACLLCGSIGTCIPAHFPHHRRRRPGGAVWDRANWVPLCGQPGACHDLIDWRVGGVSDADCALRDEARECVLERARDSWWPLP